MGNSWFSQFVVWITGVTINKILVNISNKKIVLVQVFPDEGVCCTDTKFEPHFDYHLLKRFILASNKISNLRFSVCFVIIY